MFLRFIHVVECVRTWIPLCNWIIFHCTNISVCLSIHLLVGIWVVSTFCPLWIMLLWTFVYKFLVEHLFSFLGCISVTGSGNAGSHGNYLICRVTTKLFHSSCTILHSHQHCARVPISLHPLQHFFSILHCFIMAILVLVRWCVSLILICISIVTDDDHLFMYLLAIYISSFGKCPFWSFVHFVVGLFAFLSCKSSLYLLNARPFQIHDLCILSCILWVVSSLCWWCPLMHKNFNFDEATFIFSFVAHAFGVLSKRLLTNPRLWRQISMFLI